MLKKEMKPFVILVYISSHDIVICGTWNKGFTVSCGMPIYLRRPCSAKDVGGAVLEMMQKTPFLKEEEIDPNLIAKFTGIKSLRTLSQKYHFLTISWPIEGKMIFETYTTADDGSYEPTQNTESFELSITGLEIGNYILSML